MKIKYQLIGKYSDKSTEWIIYEDKKYEMCLNEYKRFKQEYPHLKLKLIKITEEVIKR